MLKKNWQFFVFIVVLLTATYYATRSPLIRDIAAGRRINILLLGTDLVDYARHADSIILLSISPRQRTLDFISIPRDTYIKVPHLFFHRINEVYAYYWRITQSERIAATKTSEIVREYLFYNQLPINYYLVINYRAFQNFIEAVGPVEVQITRPMRYHDRAGKLNIDFSTGTYKLDGQRALEYVRFRDAAGDLGRMRRQQYFLTQLLNSAKKFIWIKNIGKIILTYRRDTFSNISFYDALSLLAECHSVDRTHFRFATLPGQIYSVFWKTAPEQISHLLKQMELSGELETLTEAPRVEVYNATRQNELARELRNYLLEMGFNVLNWGNCLSTQKYTTIKNFSGNIAAAERLKNIFPQARIINYLDTRSDTDFIITVGEDYQGMLRR